MTWPWLYNSSNAGWINEETLSNGIIRPKALSLLTYWQSKALIRLEYDKMVSLTILGSPDLLNYWIFIIERTLIHTEQFILGCSVEWLPWRNCVQLHSLPIHSSWQCSKRSNSSQCPFVKSALRSFVEMRASWDNLHSLTWYYQSIFLAPRLKIVCLRLNFNFRQAE